MKDKNNEQIVFEMLEEVATESIAEARNAYTYDEIDDCYVEAKKGPLEKVCGYRSTIKILFCPFIKLNNG